MNYLSRYLDEYYYDLVIDNYDLDYLNTISEDSFLQVYNVFDKYNFYFIKDIILNYIEIFSMDYELVEKEILKLKDKLGDDFVYIIGNDMRYLVDIIDNIDNYLLEEFQV